MYFSRNWLIVSGVLLCTGMAHAQLNIAVKPSVTPPGGGAATTPTIGNIVVNTGAGGAPPITAVFTLDPNYRWLDDWYDFRWINLVTAGPSPGGALPAIDPQIGQLPPAGGADNEPYYWDSPAVPATGYEFAANHVERRSSTFLDVKGGFANGTVITFNTYLVADDITAGGFPNQEFCILAGFSWTYNQNTPPTNPSITKGAAIAEDPDAAADAAADIASALGNAAGGGGEFPSPDDADPDEADWKPISVCTLAGCETFKRWANWPRYSKAYTVKSYKYTNTTEGKETLEWEAIADPVKVPGDPEKTIFSVPFSPNDLHMLYWWNNLSEENAETHELKIDEKGGTFTWKWFCTKTFPATFCETPGTITACRAPDPEYECGDPCVDPIDLENPPLDLDSFGPPNGEDQPFPFCGNNVREDGEQCDGTDDAKCPGTCLPDCTCEPGTKIPAPLPIGDWVSCCCWS